MRSRAGSEISSYPTRPGASRFALPDPKKAILFQGSPFRKGLGLIQVNLERKPGVEVDLPIGTGIAATSTKPAEPAGYTSGLPKTGGRHIAYRRSKIYVVQNILNV